MMSDKQRKNILRKAKKNPIWYTSNEDAQDKIIHEECVKKGFVLSDFFATDGKKLNKLLS